MAVLDTAIQLKRLSDTNSLQRFEAEKYQTQKGGYLVFHLGMDAW